METAATESVLTHPDRVLYPEQGLTKRGLAEYYHAVADPMLPHVAARPLTLVRCPRGQEEACFYQKHVTGRAPDAVRRVEIAESRGAATYGWIEDLEGLVGLVQMGTLEVHAWSSRVDDLERPDRLVFDLDPGPDVSWASVVEGARELSERLIRLDLQSFPLLTGSKGVHVVVPLARRAGWDRVKGFARAVAGALAADAPDRYVTTSRKEERTGRIFIDYLRNTRGATSVASYSTRARAGAPVATPVRWDELTPAVAPDRYSVRSLRRRLAALGSDPWEGYFDVRQGLTRAAELRVDLMG